MRLEGIAVECGNDSVALEFSIVSRLLNAGNLLI